MEGGFRMSVSGLQTRKYVFSVHRRNLFRACIFSM